MALQKSRRRAAVSLNNEACGSFDGSLSLRGTCAIATGYVYIYVSVGVGDGSEKGLFDI